MTCIECGTTIENGVYFCDSCGAHFSEDDVQIMLHVNKKRERERARKGYLLAFLILCAAIAVMVVFFSIVSRLVAKNGISAQEKYYAGIEEYFKDYEDVEEYTYTRDTLLLVIKADIWDRISENDRMILGKRLTTDITAFRVESGFDTPKCVTIQINDEEGNMLLYADDLGYVQTFDVQDD